MQGLAIIVEPVLQARNVGQSHHAIRALRGIGYRNTDFLQGASGGIKGAVAQHKPYRLARWILVEINGEIQLLIGQNGRHRNARGRHVVLRRGER